MTTAIFTNEILSAEQLDFIVGGTFTANKHDERIYNQAGMRTDYGFFAKDKFYIKDSQGNEVSITMAQADWAVEYWKKNNKQTFYEEIALHCKE